MLQWTLGCKYLFEFMFSFSSDKYPGVELLDRMVVLFLFFQGTAIQFSIVATPNSIPTNSARGFSFLHILVNTFYFLSFWQQAFWQVWGGISLWFWFAFPWWWVRLSIISCACSTVLFSTAAAPFYIPTSKAQVFQYLCILSNICHFFIITILMGVKWHFTLVLICISVITSGTEPLFMCLLAICISSLEKRVFMSFARFKKWFVCFFVVGFLLFNKNVQGTWTTYRVLWEIKRKTVLTLQV